MTIEERIQSDLVSAMKAGEAIRRDTLRFAKTALKNETVARARALSNGEAEVVIARLVKQLTQAAEEYQQLGHTDRADDERNQIHYLTPYLPAALSDTELTTLINAAVSATQAVDLQDLGKVMAALKPQVGTRADGATLAALVRAKLQG